MNSEVMKMQTHADAVAVNAARNAIPSAIPNASISAALNTADVNDFEQISALADGELPRAQAAALLARSAQDPDLRAAWHGYQLIGEVLRAGAVPVQMGLGSGRESSGARSSSAGFLADFHARLASDGAQSLSDGALSTSVLTSSPRLAVHSAFDASSSQRSTQPGAQAANESIFRWKLASGFASIAAVAAIGWGAVSSGFLGLGDTAQTMARNVSPSSAPNSTSSSQTNANSSAVAKANAGASAQSGEAPAVMQRDPRFEAYLAAHKQFGGASALAQPAGLLRSASFEAGR